MNCYYWKKEQEILTYLTLEMVLAEKPLTWLQGMHKRLKHLIISSDTF